MKKNHPFFSSSRIAFETVGRLSRVARSIASKPGEAHPSASDSENRNTKTTNAAGGNSSSNIALGTRNVLFGYRNFTRTNYLLFPLTHAKSNQMHDEVRRYLSEIGTKGGSKSKRKMSKKEARRIALIRWAKMQPKDEK